MSEVNAERLAKIYTKIRAKRLELEKEVSELQEQQDLVAKEILELFPYGYRAAIGESPVGTVIPPHTDPTGPYMLRLQIPVYTNKDCIWTTADGDQHLEEGSAYIVDTSKEHSTRNFGTTARVHFAMCLPRTHLEDIKQYF